MQKLKFVHNLFTLMLFQIFMQLCLYWYFDRLEGGE